MERENWIDWAKALGILLVVMGHSNYSIPHLTEMIFMFHMPLFFFISGYLFKTGCSYRVIHNKNIRTLVVPYILFNVVWALFVLFDYGTKAIFEAPVDWPSVFYVPLYKTALGFSGGGMFCGVAWFLLALVWCKWFSFAVHTERLLIKCTVILVWLGLIIIRHYSQANFFYCLDCGLTGFIWFELGQFFRRHREKMIIPKWLYWTLIPIGFILCYLSLRYNGQCNYIVPDTKGILGLSGTLMGLIAFLSIAKLLDPYRSRIIERVSRASILIMCMHMMVMLPLQKVLHYQYHTVVTLLGDMFIVGFITLLYPFVQKHFPLLVGGRK